MQDRKREADRGGGEGVGTLLHLTLRQLRRLLVFVIGVTVVLIGLVMLVTPGPAVVVIPVGLGILALEFAWARYLLRRFRDKAGQVGTGLRGLWSRHRRGEGSD